MVLEQRTDRGDAVLSAVLLLAILWYSWLSAAKEVRAICGDATTASVKSVTYTLLLSRTANMLMVIALLVIAFVVVDRMVTSVVLHVPLASAAPRPPDFVTPEAAFVVTRRAFGWLLGSPVLITLFMTSVATAAFVAAMFAVWKPKSDASGATGARVANAVLAFNLTIAVCAVFALLVYG